MTSQQCSLDDFLNFWFIASIDMASRDDGDICQKKSSRIGKKLSRSGLLSGGSFRLSDTRRSPPPDSSKSTAIPVVVTSPQTLSQIPSQPTLPQISLTSSTGSSSCLLTSLDDDGSDDSGATASSSSRSSLKRLTSRASDIQSYASRYLDSIRTKSRNKSTSVSPSSSTLNVGSGSKSACNSRSVSPFNPIGSAAGNSPSRMTIIGHRLAPSFLPAAPIFVSESRPTNSYTSAQSVVSKVSDNNRSPLCLVFHKYCDSLVRFEDLRDHFNLLVQKLVQNEKLREECLIPKCPEAIVYNA